MRITRITGGALLLGTAAACGGEPRSEARREIGGAPPAAAAADTLPPAAEVARAREAANALGRDLQGMLFAALDSAGPDGAIAVCADSAQVRSARHAAQGVYVRRVSLRARNPANRPDSLEERELRRLDSLHRAGALPGEVVRQRRFASGETVVDYLRPIVVQERCLACHGDGAQLAPAVRRVLARRYPDDRATGYRAGDLRGALSVRVHR
jgi:hypothetical protein